MTHSARVPINAPQEIFQEAVAETLSKLHLEISYNILTGFADTAIFIANGPVEVLEVREVHTTAGSHGSAVSLQVEKCTGTTAPGSGTNLLTNNSDVGFNLKGTANTVQEGTLTATRATRQLAAGDRLALDFAGTLTALAGVCVTIKLGWI